MHLNFEGSRIPWHQAAASAAAEAGPLVGATLEYATGGVVIAFAEILEDA